MTIDLTRYDPVWRASEPYMRARKNDVHIPLSFDWCVRLLDHFPQADRDVCLLAILLHDIGWWAIDLKFHSGYKKSKGKGQIGQSNYHNYDHWDIALI